MRQQETSHRARRFIAKDTLANNRASPECALVPGLIRVSPRGLKSGHMRHPLVSLMGHLAKDIRCPLDRVTVRLSANGCEYASSASSGTGSRGRWAHALVSAF